MRVHANGNNPKCEETHRRNRAIARFDFPVIECGGSFTERPPLVDAFCFQTYPAQCAWGRISLTTIIPPSIQIPRPLPRVTPVPYNEFASK
jgi:hypothetical protein